LRRGRICPRAEVGRRAHPAGAGERHLLGLKRALYEEIYENAERADLPEGLVPVEQRTVCDVIEVTGAAQIGHLFSMTPYYWRTSPEDKRKLEGLETLKTEIAFDCRVYRKP
jgi:23S rRNA (guanine745-N1)-methyltransferase